MDCILVNIKTEEYFFNEDGSARIGWYVDDVGNRYYYNTKGTLQKGCWFTVSKKKYYTGEDGKLYIGTHVIDGVSYTFNAKGALVVN